MQACSDKIRVFCMGVNGEGPFGAEEEVFHMTYVLRHCHLAGRAKS